MQPGASQYGHLNTSALPAMLILLFDEGRWVWGEIVES